MRSARAAGLLLAVTLFASAAGGQEVPKYTKERQKAVEGLIVACVKAKAVEITGRGPKAVVRVDPKKLKEVVAARRDEINTELIDGLLAFWGVCDEPYEPMAVALLRACGEEKKDE